MGIGRVYKLNKKTNIDISGKFLFMYQGEKDIKLSSGDNLKYGSVESGRIRKGAKADYELSERKLSKYKIKILLIFCFILKICSNSIMAQDIVITDLVVNDAVSGNGTYPYGFWPLTVAPSNNRVTISGIAGVNGVIVAGASDTTAEVSVDVASNTVVINILGLFGWQGHIAGDVCGGRALGPGNNAINNSLRIEVGTINGANGAYGGYSNTGRAEGNILEMTGGVITQNAYGGFSQGGEAISNRLRIEGGNIGGGASGGGSANGKAQGNTLEMTGGTIAGAAYGGYSVTGRVEENVLEMLSGGAGGTIRGDAYGGWGKGEAINNRLSITNGTIGGIAYGGRSDNGIAQGNTLEMLSGGAGGTIRGDAYGGFGVGEAINNRLRIANGSIGGGASGGVSDNGKAQGNTLEMTGGTIAGAAYGGYSVTGRVEENVLEMLSGGVGGTITGDAYGGWGVGEVINNRLRIANGSIGGGACGGRSINGIAQGNTLEVTGGVIEQVAYGGWGVGETISNRLRIEGGTIKGAGGASGGVSDNGKAQGNTLEMTGGTIAGAAYGGYSVTGRVEENVLEMLSGGVGGTITGDAYGGWGVGEVINNRLRIANGSIGGVAYGGYSNSGIARDNTMEVTGGTIPNSAYGGYSNNGDAISNTLKISSGTIKGDVIGGRGSLDANENKVIISGGEILANVYGGRSINNGGAVGNSIEISGDAKFSSTNTYIYGGYSYAAEKDTFTNNVFNIKKDNIEIAGMGGFQILNFYNPVKNGNAMIICIKDKVDIDNVEVNAEMNVDEDVDVDDKYIFIRSNSGFKGSVKEVNVTQGVLAKYKAAMFINNNTELGIVITDEYINPRAEILTQGKAVNTEVVNKGLDLVVDRGIGLAKDTSIVSKGVVVPFGTLKGGKTKLSYRGSNINMDEIGGMGGIAKEFNVGGTKVVVGGFLENGRASYRLVKEIEGVGVEGVGSTNYVGIGILARVEMINDSYVEGSFRVGKYDVDYKTEGLDEEKEERNTSDYSSVYIGGHIGIGRVYKIKKKTNIEVSGKFLFMYQGEKDIKLSSGDNLRYGSVKSGRIRIGAKAGYELSKRKLRDIRPYAGISYEQEVMGEIEAKTIDIELPRVELKYGKCIGEVGVRKEIGKFNIDCSVKKYVGREEGIEGMVRARYCFDKENIALIRMISKVLKRSKYSTMVSDKSLRKVKSKTVKAKKDKG